MIRLINYYQRHGFKNASKQLILRSLTRLRIAIKQSQGKGSFPDFLIIGVMKGGTTSMYNYLCQHPAIEPAMKKEIHFFDIDRVYNRGFDWYMANFTDECELYPLKITGEASPCYIFVPGALERIKKHLPTVKIILMLRNPVDRAWSHYNMMVEKGYETLSAGVAFSNEELRLRHGDWKDKRLFSYIKRSQYPEQIEKLTALFDKKQILIIDSEDFFNNPVCFCSAVFEFLGVKDFEVDASVVHTKGNYKPIPAHTRKYLERFFNE